jgi:hypothetical protein
MRVLFKNIGRTKATWEEDVESERGLLQALLRRKVLMSKDIDINWNGEEGSIFAGGFHWVGEIHLVKPKEDPKS